MIIGGRKTSPYKEGSTRSFSEELGREVTARSAADVGAGTGTDAGDASPGDAGAQHACHTMPLILFFLTTLTLFTSPITAL